MMKISPYSPDEFMSGLYDKLRTEPYKNATAENVSDISENIKQKAKDIFNLSLIENDKIVMQSEKDMCRGMSLVLEC